MWISFFFWNCISLFCLIPKTNYRDRPSDKRLCLTLLPVQGRFTPQTPAETSSTQEAKLKRTTTTAHFIHRPFYGMHSLTRCTQLTRMQFYTFRVITCRFFNGNAKERCTSWCCWGDFCFFTLSIVSTPFASKREHCNHYDMHHKTLYMMRDSRNIGEQTKSQTMNPTP